MRQLASKSQQESRVDLLSPEWSRKVRGFHAFMAAISDWQTPLKALLQVEIFWRQESGRFKSNDLAYIRASLEEEMDMRTENTLVVQFRWSSHSLFWVKEPKCHHFRMFHLVDEEATPEEEAKRTSSFNDRILERIFDEELVGIAETEVNILRRYVRALALNSTGITLVGDVDLFRDENDGGQNNELLLLQGGKQCEMLATLVQLRMDEHQTQQQQSLHDRLIWMDDKLLVATTGEEEKEMEEYSESKNSIDEKVQQSASSSSIESIRSYKIVYLEDGHLAALTPGHLRQYRIAPELLVVLITESEEKDGCRRRESHLYRLALGALKTGTRLVVGIVVNCGGDEDQWRQSSTMTRRTVKLWSEEILAGVS